MSSNLAYGVRVENALIGSGAGCGGCGGGPRPVRPGWQLARNGRAALVSASAADRRYTSQGRRPATQTHHRPTTAVTADSDFIALQSALAGEYSLDRELG